jgi:sigma-E factor negative regulatory protein RseC
MIEEKAIVVAVKDEMVTVTSEVKSACSGCQQVDNCGSGQVAKAFPQKKLSLTLLSKLSLNIGDVVVIGLNESQLLKTAWQVYLWPLIGLIFGAWLGQYFVVEGMFKHEVFAIVLSVITGYAGFYLARSQQNKNQNCAHLAPQILRVEEKNIIAINKL